MEMNPFWGVQRELATENDVQATVQSIMTVIDLKGAAGREAPCCNEHSPQLNNKSQSCSQPATATTYHKVAMTTECKYLVPHSCTSQWEPIEVVIYLSFWKRRWTLFVYDGLKMKMTVFEFIKCRKVQWNLEMIPASLYTLSYHSKNQGPNIDMI
jgi:hypothetical protein